MYNNYFDNRQKDVNGIIEFTVNKSNEVEDALNEIEMEIKVAIRIATSMNETLSRTASI